MRRSTIWTYPVVLLLAALSLAACSKSPAVTMSSAPNGEYRLPDNLPEVMSGTLHRAILTCYEGSSSEAVGTTVIRVKGSHGLLDVALESGSGDQVLDACASDTIQAARMAREIGDTEDFIGFVLTVVYTRE